MFMGITAHHSAPRVSSYEEAQRAVDKYRAKEALRRRRKPIPADQYALGGHNKSVTWVRQDEATGAIAFQLYDTDVVTWHPDNSFEIDNFGSATTTGFASRFTPRGIHLNRPVQIRGSEGGNTAIVYVTPDEHRMCQGMLVRFRLVDGFWAPDVGTLDPIRLPDVDRKLAREATAGLPWKDFENWLAMAPMHLDLEHVEFDVEECADALRKRDFRQATVHLPLVQIPNGWGAERRIKPLPIQTGYMDQVITMGSIGKLKLALMEQAGAIGVEEFTTVSCREYARRMARVSELRKLGFRRYSDMGAS